MDSKPRILIVDDDPLNVKLMAAGLAGEPYGILKAFDGQQALDIVASQPPDLILLDVMMPGLDGFSVTQKLKNNPETRDIPIILVTALDSTDDKVRGLEAGADEFLNKPVNLTELTARIKSFLRLKEYKDQIKAHSQVVETIVYPEQPIAADQPGSERNSILLVEDSDKDIRLIQAHLQNENYDISLARSGEETLSAVQGSHIDLILLDILLPGMNGFDVCRRLKESDQTRDIQIVAVTCLQDLESKLKGLELGVDEFLVKPINEQELRVRVRALLKKKVYLDRLHVNYESAIQYAITDQRTGLFNHGYFEHILGLEIKRSLRQAHPVSLLMIDIDNFKQFNDSLGHLAGDKILQELGRLIRTNIRDEDLGARYGGEEFVVVLPYTALEGAARSAERLRDRIYQNCLPPELSRTCGKLTVSIGVACCPADAQNAEDLIKNADAALYRAKEQGKNRVCCFVQ